MYTHRFLKKINAKDEEAKERMKNLTVPQKEDRAF